VGWRQQSGRGRSAASANLRDKVCLPRWRPHHRPSGSTGIAAGLCLLWALSWIGYAAVTPVRDYRFSLSREGVLVLFSVVSTATSYVEAKFYWLLWGRFWRTVRRSRYVIATLVFVKVLGVGMYIHARETNRSLVLYTVFVPTVVTLSVLAGYGAISEIRRWWDSRRTPREPDTEEDAESRLPAAGNSESAELLVTNTIVLNGVDVVATQTAFPAMYSITGHAVITPVVLGNIYILAATRRRFREWSPTYRRLAVLAVFGNALVGFDTFSVIRSVVWQGAVLTAAMVLTLAVFTVIDRRARGGRA